MNTRDLGPHIHQRFDADLDSLHGKVLRMGGLVEQQLADAMVALLDGDSELAERVIAQDHRVNALEVDVDEESTHVLARRQPMAGDLRFIVSVIKTITDLERMGDESVRIARMALRHAGHREHPGGEAALRHLGTHVRAMMHDALDAFARMDPGLAVQVVSQDRRVDREYESLTRELITFMMEDPRAIPRSLDVMFSARALERIGDRACNIVEYVIYFVHGKDVRHTTLEQVRSELGRAAAE